MTTNSQSLNNKWSDHNVTVFTLQNKIWREKTFRNKISVIFFLWIETCGVWGMRS